MKKTLTVLGALLVPAGAQAASIDYTQLSQDLKDHVILAWSMEDNGDIYNPQNVSFGSSSTTLDRAVDSETGEAYAHLDSSSNKPWTTGLSRTNDGNFTLSFDLNRWNGNAWGAILGLSSEGAGDAYSMQFGIDNADPKALHLYHKVGGSTAYGGVSVVDSYKTSLTADTDLGWTTITLVSDADNALLSLYMDGELVYTQENWVAAEGKSLTLSGLQVGAALGGRGSTLVDIDNITLLDVALDEASVKSLIVPEPATASLSLLGLAALMMRRRRA